MRSIGICTFTRREGSARGREERQSLGDKIFRREEKGLPEDGVNRKKAVISLREGELIWYRGETGKCDLITSKKLRGTMMGRGKRFVGFE